MSATTTSRARLAAALFARFRSRVEESYADQLLSAMRFGFGGHVEKKE